VPIPGPKRSIAISYAAGVGSGNNYQDDIVQFVGVRITYVDNSSVMVQPGPVTDPDAIFTNPKPAQPPTPGTATLSTTFSYARLTRGPWASPPRGPAQTAQLPVLPSARGRGFVRAVSCLVSSARG
jgi:hypothetical protein